MEDRAIVTIDSPADRNSELAGENNTMTTPSSLKNRKHKNRRNMEKKESNLEFTWICAECHEAECFVNLEAPLLLCDGKCNRPFHPPCANLLTLPLEDELWLCVDCLQKKHQCAVCKDYGEDDIDLFCCEAKGCGLFFHENCLNVYTVNIQILEEEISAEPFNSYLKDGVDDFMNEEKKESNYRACISGESASIQMDESIATSTKLVSRPKFRCPAHKCWTCAGDTPPMETNQSEVHTWKSLAGQNRKQVQKCRSSFSSMWGAKKERLFRCLDCPISYHITCMPPSCRFHELAMLCHEHSHTSKLPYLDDAYSFQAEVEADAEKKIIENRKRKVDRTVAANASGSLLGCFEVEGESDVEENLFLPGVIGSVAMFQEDQLVEFFRNDDEANRKRKKPLPFHFSLPCDMKDEVHSKPPAYTHVNANRYNSHNRPKRHPPNGESCQCKPSTKEDVNSCGDRCLNRLSYVECVGDRTLKSGEKNPHWNCNCGPNCGNRAMSQRLFSKCRPMHEHGKGWGLIAINGVKRGDLVQEYAGEIIDEETKEERLKSWACDHPNDPNFYIMLLEPGWYIDAREVANLARFINHSCDPNCKLVPVNVAGHVRVSIMCIKNVSLGDFLSYDYQFDTQHGEKFICRCGARNCRGTMKGGRTDGKVTKKTKKQLLSEARARTQRDKKFLHTVLESERERLCLTGPFVPGEDIEKAEMVAGGPKERYRREVQEGRIFLWRNATVGGDFFSRFWETVLHVQGEKKPSHHLASLCYHLGTSDVLSVIKA